jgi:DNA-directed RNA polymerase specialized sigma24 family protein
MGHRIDDTRSITARSLARLLARLHPDVEQAGLEYERLRRALVKFFDWRGTAEPEECADDAIDRLARKLDETVIDDLRSYAWGIARMVLLERRRTPAPSSLDGDAAAARLPAAPPPDDSGRLHQCFDLCLNEIPEEGRSVVLRYYEGERSAKISNRRRLATELGLSENALRSRVQRLRDRLEQCVRDCAELNVKR